MKKTMPAYIPVTTAIFVSLVFSPWLRETIASYGANWIACIQLLIEAHHLASRHHLPMFLLALTPMFPTTSKSLSTAFILNFALVYIVTIHSW